MFIITEKGLGVIEPLWISLSGDLPYAYFTAWEKITQAAECQVGSFSIILAVITKVHIKGNVA